MSMGFATIDDLLKSKPKTDDSVSSASSSNEPEDREAATAKFSQKMVGIQRQGFETDAARRAAQLGLPYLNLEQFPVSQEALRQIPREIAEEKKVVCFFATPDEIRLGALDPTNPAVTELLAEIRDRNHADGAIYLISEASLNRVLTLYNALPVVKAITKDITVTEESIAAVQSDVTDFSSFQALIDRKSTTDLLIIILAAVLKLDGSDVHIEVEGDKLVIRFRLDGVLHDVASLPKTVAKPLLSRIKLTSSLKINITDAPQDGRFTITLSKYDVDVRVSTIPTVHGESVVMRLLRQTGQKITLDDLGVRGRALEMLKTEIARPNGMIIITGPTGSGKSTTLYAILTLLNKPGVKIITLEDPVEYRIPGVNQSQIEHTKDYTFAKGLRSILRQDPDIVMVGEIRDLETADIAVQAALTGHLLLSTIHTNSASGAVPRFMAMGVKPFLLTPALNCLIGQRLVRKVCVQCRVTIKLEAMDSILREKVSTILNTIPAHELETRSKDTFYKAAGCAACNNLGYKGRIGICELFIMTPEIEQAIAAGSVSEFQIEQLARKQGMITMAEDGILKALDGITTVEEVFRVTE